MPPHSQQHDTVDAVVAQSRDRGTRYRAWISELRAGDPAFHEASTLCPDDMNEWQAAAYLLTGCDEVWGALRDPILAELSIAAAIEQQQCPCRAWSSSEDAVMQWAAHFWDVDRWPARFPYVFEEHYFRRWISACHLYKRIPPTGIDGGVR